MLFSSLFSRFSVPAYALVGLVGMAQRAIGLATGEATSVVVASSPYHAYYATYHNP